MGWLRTSIKQAQCASNNGTGQKELRLRSLPLWLKAKMDDKRPKE